MSPEKSLPRFQKTSTPHHLLVRFLKHMDQLREEHSRPCKSMPTQIVCSSSPSSKLGWEKWYLWETVYNPSFPLDATNSVLESSQTNGIFHSWNIFSKLLMKLYSLNIILEKQEVYQKDTMLSSHRTLWKNSCRADTDIWNRLVDIVCEGEGGMNWAGDAIQPSHPLSSPSPPAFNLSQNQSLFKWVSSLNQVAKALESQLHHQSFQWIFRTDLL